MSKSKLNPAVSSALNNMKAEIAAEQGVQLGANATARQNGSVGGEITKRLVKQAKDAIASK